MPTPETVSIEVRSATKTYRWENAPDWDGLTLHGALSSDPRSIHELCQSWARYQPCNPLISADRLHEVASDDSRLSEPWMVIDLDQRLLWASAGADLAEQTGCYQFQDDDEDESEDDEELLDADRRTGNCPENLHVWINMPDDWQVMEGVAWEWGQREPSPPHEPIDARGIMYGRVMAEKIAQQMLEQSQHAEFPSFGVDLADFENHRGYGRDRQRQRLMMKLYEFTVAVHANWLRTPLSELGNEPPYTFLHRRRSWVDREIAHRCAQWGIEHQMPRPLDRDTYTYVYGPFSSTEVIIYFDYCRALIQYGWVRIHDAPDISKEDLASAIYDYSRNYLLRTPGESHGPSQGEIIELSRRHMPIQDSGFEPNCDCPICQQMAAHPDLFGPSFIMFDSSVLELDEDPVFSLDDC